MRALIAGSIAIIGLGGGALVELVSGFPPGPLASFGGAVGLTGGIALARQTYPRPERR